MTCFVNFTSKRAELVILLFPSRLALEEKAAYVARCTAEECESTIEETLAEEVASIAQEILDEGLRHIRKFIKRFDDLIISLYL